MTSAQGHNQDHVGKWHGSRPSLGCVLGEGVQRAGQLRAEPRYMEAQVGWLSAPC